MEPIKYIPQNERDELWGLTVCSVGYQKCLPGESYPCGNHNQEYLFQPEKGRVLCEYQLLYVAEGEGTLETRTAGKIHVSAGDMFLIHPGEWHTYAPDPETGWKEYWIGFSGINVDSRVAAGFLPLECPLYNIGYNETVIELYREAIRVAKKQEKYFQQLLAGIVNHLLGLMFMINSNRVQSDSSIPRLMDKARAFMQESVESELEMPAVAEYLNIGYSTFRHEFKKYTGLSPAQYFINLKIHRAKQILRSSSTSIKEIAYMLHFDSPEYFTTLFKKKTGMNPTKFREQ